MTNLKIFNGTPHAINVVKGATFSPSIRKWTGGQVVLSISSSGMLNAKIDVEELNPLGEIPIFGKKISGCDPLPEGYDIYIVSALYSSAALKSGMDVSKCYTVADPVMSEDGTTFVGCRGLAPLF
jgi:hypothetical protein